MPNKRRGAAARLIAATAGPHASQRGALKPAAHGRFLHSAACTNAREATVTSGLVADLSTFMRQHRGGREDDGRPDGEELITTRTPTVC